MIKLSEVVKHNTKEIFNFSAKKSETQCRPPNKLDIDNLPIDSFNKHKKLIRRDNACFIQMYDSDIKNVLYFNDALDSTKKFLVFLILNKIANLYENTFELIKLNNLAVRVENEIKEIKGDNKLISLKTIQRCIDAFIDDGLIVIKRKKYFDFSIKKAKKIEGKSFTQIDLETICEIIRKADNSNDVYVAFTILYETLKKGYHNDFYTNSIQGIADLSNKVCGRILQTTLTKLGKDEIIYINKCQAHDGKSYGYIIHPRFLDNVYSESKKKESTIKENLENENDKNASENDKNASEKRQKCIHYNRVESTINPLSESSADKENKTSDKIFGLTALKGTIEIFKDLFNLKEVEKVDDEKVTLENIIENLETNQTEIKKIETKKGVKDVSFKIETNQVDIPVIEKLKVDEVKNRNTNFGLISRFNLTPSKNGKDYRHKNINDIRKIISNNSYFKSHSHNHLLYKIFERLETKGAWPHNRDKNENIEISLDQYLKLNKDGKGMIVEKILNDIKFEREEAKRKREYNSPKQVGQREYQNKVNFLRDCKDGLRSEFDKIEEKAMRQLNEFEFDILQKFKPWHVQYKKVDDKLRMIISDLVLQKYEELKDTKKEIKISEREQKAYNFVTDICDKLNLRYYLDRAKSECACLLQTEPFMTFKEIGIKIKKLLKHITRNNPEFNKIEFGVI